MLLRIVHIHYIIAIPNSLYESVNNKASQLWGNKMPLYGQHFATDPSSVSPVSVAAIFLPSNMESIHHHLSVSNPMPFGSVCYVTWSSFRSSLHT